MQTSDEAEAEAVRAIDDAIRESSKGRKADEARKARPRIIKWAALLVLLGIAAAAVCLGHYGLGAGVFSTTALGALILANLSPPSRESEE